jgi:hypothetical protein
MSAAGVARCESDRDTTNGSQFPLLAGPRMHCDAARIANDTITMRFRLRTLLLAFLLVCLSAPWWPGIYRDVRDWLFPPPPPPLTSEEAFLEMHQLLNDLSDTQSFSEAEKRANERDRKRAELYRQR